MKKNTETSHKNDVIQVYQNHEPVATSRAMYEPMRTYCKQHQTQQLSHELN